MFDGQQSDEQYMKELYEKFRAGVRNNNNAEFYEEDELLDIYDYAQDEGDDMVQLYVLLTGARLYPDSDFLDERKAFFLSSINDEAARNMLTRKGRRDSALWGVLKLALDTYPDGNPEEPFTELLASDYRFSCEAIIRLIDILTDLGRLDLIAEHLHILREKAENPTLLYYEAAEALYRDDRFTARARDIAEELTQAEPFNPDNWVILAKIEFALQHPRECVAAADYALAIDPENQHALLVRGIGLVAEDDSAPEGTAVLQKVLGREPSNAIAAKALAEGYLRQNKRKAALEVYTSFMEANPSGSVMIADAMKLHPDNADSCLERFAASEGDNERKWLEVAAQLANDGEEVEAVRMLSFFNERYSLREGMEYFLQLLYRLKKYGEYASIFGKCCADAQNPGSGAFQFSATAYLLLASSYLLSGLYEEAIKICNLMLESPPVATDFDEHLRWKGMQLTLTFIRNLAKNPSILPKSADFDPITFSIPVS